MSNEKDKKKRDLANPPAARAVSDYLDSIFWKNGYKETSCSRGIVHGGWHTIAGVVRGKDDEYDRAKEQFGQCSLFAPSKPEKDGKNKK